MVESLGEGAAHHLWLFGSLGARAGCLPGTSAHVEVRALGVWGSPPACH